MKPISHEKKSLSGADVVILAGGLGTRLRSAISDRPKVIAEVAGKPFLEIIIGALSEMGAQRIILSVGYMKDAIKIAYADRGIVFAEEEEPLGTGGGLKNAKQLILSDHVVVMNGDSWIAGGIDVDSLFKFHRDQNALVTLLLTQPREEKDYGAVFLDAGGKVTHFSEKSAIGAAHFMNAGVYCMDKKVFGLMPEGAFSLENDFFPKLVGDALYGFPVEGEIVDIGTPERYARAHKIFSANK